MLEPRRLGCVFAVGPEALASAFAAIPIPATDRPGGEGLRQTLKCNQPGSRLATALCNLDAMQRGLSLLVIYACPKCR
jgi:hypothetical protein